MTFQSWPRLNRPLRVENSAVQNSASLNNTDSQLSIAARSYAFRAAAWIATHDLGDVTPCVVAGGGEYKCPAFGLAHGSIIGPLDLFVLTYVQVSRSIFWPFSPFDLIIVQAPCSNTSPFTRKYLAVGNSPSRAHCLESVCHKPQAQAR